MIPAELTPKKVRLPDAGVRNIVVVTGTQLRHDRFALRLQQEFGSLVIGWFQVESPTDRNVSQESTTVRSIQQIKDVLRSPRRRQHARRYLARRIRDRVGRSRISQGQVEERMFRDEVNLLRESAHLEPRRVRDPNSPEVVNLVKSLDPYFLLTLGGAIYRKPLLQCARGLALNQHNGWCPTYKGTGTVNWALFHRDIAHLGSTVHVLTSGMDAGPILRRSTVCLVEDDTPQSCFARVVALGTELMCEVVAEAIRSDELTVYDQPGDSGYTYLNSQLTGEVREAVERDFRNGWLGFELSRLRQF